MSMSRKTGLAFKVTLVFLVPLVVGALSFSAPRLAHADLLQDIKTRGTLIAGVKDSIPPFGFIDPATRTIVGYDIDFAAAIAKALGVKLRTVPVTTATRIPELMQGKIDLIAATMTNSPERAKQIDFSLTYFVTGQKVLMRKDVKIANVADLKGKRVSSVRGSTSEQNIRRTVPGVQVIAFNDYPNAFLALAQRKVVGMTTDEIILLDLQKRSPKPGDFVLLDEYISTEPYGLGVRKGEPAFLKEVNRVLLEMEKSGEAAEIFDRWFGAKSATPLKRTFKITEQN
jgi:polar amino acid transport system substrate-binding protein